MFWMVFCYSSNLRTQNRHLIFRVFKHLFAQRSSKMATGKHRIGIIQMTSTENKQKNFKFCEDNIQKSKAAGAECVFLPECFDYVIHGKQESVEAAETLEGDIISRYKALAKQCDVWLSLGGFHRKANENEEKGGHKLYNTHLIINNHGEIQATYAKAHLFDVKGLLLESDYVFPGNEIVPPVTTPVGNVGLQICYDLRFPEMSICQREQGAHILTFPSAFMVATGTAHWTSLLRCRAIENQCYVIAAAQTGWHNPKRASYGHSMVVDPWGTVLADFGEDETGFKVVDIDLGNLEDTRKNMPVHLQKRRDLYGSIVHSQDAAVSALDAQDTYTFGQVNISSKQVFYRTALSYSCVNIKPVLPGHALVVPLQRVERFTDLSSPQVVDLFLTVQKVSAVLQRLHKTTSVTIAIQDGPDAGQTIKHVHIHVIPRQQHDLPFNDDIYQQLEKHDDIDDPTKFRSESEMAEEAEILRRIIYTAD